MSSNEDIEVCECKIIHKEVVATVKGKLTDNWNYTLMAEFYKSFTDAARIKILTALTHSDMCVCDLVELLQMSQPAVSHHLRQLKAARIIKFRKDGKFVYYSLDDKHISTILKAGFKHIKEIE
jgi:ArsR family transcriptional regulator, lead/cadmium/zinc/bismuth-responsive transcriptional repressor